MPTDEAHDVVAVFEAVQRVQRLWSALYTAPERAGDGQTQTDLGDLLTDLHHWADATGLDWDEAMAAHDLHYFAEVTEI